MDFEAIRQALNKRLKALQILAFVEALVIFFLTFQFSKDVIIALFFAVLAGVLFFRILGRKLMWGRNELVFKMCEEFLKQNNAKFDKQGFYQKDFEKIAFDFSLKTYHSQNSFIFDDFILYDVKFKDEFGNFFCGILLYSKKLKEDISSSESIFEKVKDKEFSTQRVLKKDDYLLIASLKNPFFADLKISSELNFKLFRANLEKIQTFIHD
ncbi:poly(A) polymerase [Campylobacter lari]|uniref:poly(A) polymerase n=1 Tax=Campylobacter sp. CNRCH_2007_0968H TaxID=2911598 RepID=UPI00126CEB9D|nr:poly(A) polymerase [Campylobacter sp. CNRCH_2007_0968H]EAJ5678427.1 poly(A) polymerase [Campylobacter lari]EAK0444681.1 poly(A) polymerase [Campylobacter lari]EAK9943401.1 poly(A) polymerase [Campylobacter lari]MCV3530932.1 poly(A) polymerase [Campylobacter sp. CNRCH_2007_0968H]